MKNIIAFLGAASLCVACHHKPPPAPPPPPPPPPVVAPPPPPPPAPPKCEALTESCTGQNGTLARIRKSGFSIVVPNGWTYAQQDDATIATENSAIFAVTTYEAADPKAADAAREASFEALLKLLGVTPPKHKVTWTHPMKKSKVGALEVALWQTDDVAYADKKGAMLVFGTQLPDKSWLLGGGFVPADDTTDSDKAILNAIQSIAPSPGPTPAPATSP
ncbi:MAG TPA: hypothetical protein VIF15_05710 [Polyangiaceae bacterium]